MVESKVSSNNLTRSRSSGFLMYAAQVLVYRCDVATLSVIALRGPLCCERERLLPLLLDRHCNISAVFKLYVLCFHGFSSNVEIFS